ncbi:MAG: S1 RNA-binding domain-containing protein [Chloroflexota bacterium]
MNEGERPEESMATEEADFSQELEQLLDQHDYDTPQVGDIRKGIIVSISQQGIIVDLGLKRDGLIQPADLSKLEPGEREALQVNDEIPVFILNTDEPDGLLVSLYRARLNQDWIQAEALLESGEIFEGEVTGYNRGGAIVAFGRVRAFVPDSHLLELGRNLNDKQRQQKMSLLRGKKLYFRVIEVDRRRRRLVVSQREAEKERRELVKRQLVESLSEGTILKGHVTGLRDFGAFVDLGGAEGLIHVSELAWHRVNHPKEVVKVGDEIDVYVLKLDPSGQRIALSRKRAIPDPWTLVSEKYLVGQLIEGVVTRIMDYGAFVEIEPGIEGLLHTSQLSRTPISDPHQVIQEGETHLLRVISIEPDRQRIGLSLKQVTANEQIDWMARRSATPEPAPAAPKSSKAQRRAAREAERRAAVPPAEAEQPPGPAEPDLMSAPVEPESQPAAPSPEPPVETRLLAGDDDGLSGEGENLVSS